jgi:hypothetical protein
LLALAVLLPEAQAARPPHQRLDELARQSVETGLVSYRQVAETIYGSETDRIIELKRQWRQSQPDAIWLSDYDLLSSVAVRVRVEPRETLRRGQTAARYTLHTNTVTLPRETAGALLAHEAGHGLTRRSIRSDAAKGFVDPSLDVGLGAPRGSLARESSFDQQWLGYIATQAEFEIRLQALNRFHYLERGRVIDSPGEALHALAVLGVTLAPAEIEEIVSSREAPVVLRQARATQLGDPGRLFEPELFRNAHDVRRALQMAAAWDPGIRRDLLRKIAREAPGHF